MGCSSGPDIIQDGLVLCLDAASKRSYNGSGTTWTDLSTVGSDGTLNNGPTFNTENGGSFSFDGTDDYVELSSLSTSLFGDGNASLFCFLKSYTSSANSGGDSGIFGFGSSGLNNHYTWTGGRAYLDTFRTSRIQTSILTGGIVDKGKPHAICITTKNGGNWNFYQIQNENLVLQYTTSAGTFGMSHSRKKIGYSISSSYIFRGSFYNFMIYNKELSFEEIRQNYLSTKERFA